MVTYARCWRIKKVLFFFLEETKKVTSWSLEEVRKVLCYRNKNLTSRCKIAIDRCCSCQLKNKEVVFLRNFLNKFLAVEIFLKKKNHLKIFKVSSLGYSFSLSLPISFPQTTLAKKLDRFQKEF